MSTTWLAWHKGHPLTSVKTLTTTVFIMVVISIPSFYKKKLKAGIGETKSSFEEEGTPECQQRNKVYFTRKLLIWMNENSFWTALWRGMVRPCLGSLESNGMTIWHGLGGWWAVIWMLWDPRVNRKCEWWVEDPRSMKDTWLHEKSEETNLPWTTTAILNFVISDLMILAALINPLPSTPPTRAFSRPLPAYSFIILLPTYSNLDFVLILQILGPLSFHY